MTEYFYKTFVDGGKWGLLGYVEAFFWKNFLLWSKAGDGEDRACDALLRVGADPGAIVWAHPPMHHAAWRGHDKVQTYFMYKGTKMDVKDRWTMTVDQVNDCKANKVDCILHALLSFSDDSHIAYCHRCKYQPSGCVLCFYCSYNSPFSSCPDCKYSCFSC